MNAEEKKRLAITACKVRIGTINGVYNAKSGHPGGITVCRGSVYVFVFSRNADRPQKSANAGS